MISLFLEKYDLNNCKVYVTFRPFLKEFLEDMKDAFELVLFTTGKREERKAIFDFLQKEGNYFTYCIYNDHVLEEIIPGMSPKNFYVLMGNRIWDNTIFLESDPDSFSLSLFSGIPIQEFESRWRNNDKELPKIGKILEGLNKWASVCTRIGYYIENLVPKSLVQNIHLASSQ